MKRPALLSRLRLRKVNSMAIALVIIGLVASCDKPPSELSYPYPKEDFQHNWQTHKLKGRVKMLKETSASVKGGHASSTSLYFDEKGNLTREVKLSSNPALSTDFEFEYDDRGNETKSYMRKGNGKMYCESTFRYDEYGRRVFWEDDYDSARHGINFFFVDRANGYDLVRRQFFQQGAGASNFIRFSYDSLSRKARQQMHRGDSTSVVIEQIFTSYDSRGNIIEQTSKDKNDRLTSAYVNKYDDNNSLVMRKSVLFDSTLNSEQHYEYDSAGNLISSRYADHDTNSITRYKYTYDKQGNWIFRETQESDSTVVSVKREITYY